ncbi:hypothetical protein [Bifidobacterium catulorum]|nr:hypothetical protein [Bifidobacterium catulorum]
MSKVTQLYYTPTQVSQLAGGSPTVKTLAKWRTLGTQSGLPFIKLGPKREGCKNDNRRVLYPVKTTERWLKANGYQSRTLAA